MKCRPLCGTVFVWLWFVRHRSSDSVVLLVLGLDAEHWQSWQLWILRTHWSTSTNLTHQTRVVWSNIGAGEVNDWFRILIYIIALFSQWLFKHRIVFKTLNLLNNHHNFTGCLTVISDSLEPVTLALRMILQTCQILTNMSSLQQSLQQSLQLSLVVFSCLQLSWLNVCNVR